MKASTHKEHGNKGYLEDQRKFFDKLITQDWDDYNNRDWDRARQEEVDKLLLNLQLPKRVLDLGCGCGYHDMLFAQKDHVQKVIAVDNSKMSVAKADKVYKHPKVERYVVDFFNNREFILSKGPYDLVASFQVIEHLSKADEFIKISSIFTREGGHVAIVTPNRYKLQNLLLKFTGKPIEMIDPLHFQEFGVTELKELGHKCGLKIVSYFGRDINLFIRGKQIIKTKSIFGKWLVSKFPRFCDVIGVIFQK